MLDIEIRYIKKIHTWQINFTPGVTKHTNETNHRSVLCLFGILINGKYILVCLLSTLYLLPNLYGCPDT